MEPPDAGQYENPQRKKGRSRTLEPATISEMVGDTGIEPVTFRV
jgi:hypothetical protein